MNALIFDCDGVLADTERCGHLPAFNQTFEEFELPVRWTELDYGEKLRIGGGKERMASLLTPEFVARAGLPTDPDEQAGAIAVWHRRKTEIYTQLIGSGLLPPRPGISRLIADALDAGWQVAVASTSARPSVTAVLKQAVGENAARIPVFAGDDVPAKKPAPDIYLLTLEQLGLDPAQTLVVEDSHSGLLAAKAAGLRCLVTVNGYTRDEDMREADIVLSSLGDPDGEQTEVLRNDTAAEPLGHVTLADLAACLVSRTRELA